MLSHLASPALYPRRGLTGVGVGGILAEIWNHVRPAATEGSDGGSMLPQYLLCDFSPPRASLLECRGFLQRKMQLPPALGLR